MADFKFYRGMVLEPDNERRVRFRTVAAGSPNFNKIDTCPTIEQALDLLDREKCDVVFIGELTNDEIQDFLKQGKKTRYGRLSAYVFLKKERPQTKTDAAAQMAAGADSVLYEPYSVDSVTETTKIADQIREAEEQKKRETALALILNETVKSVDLLADPDNSDEERRDQTAKLKQMGSQLQTASKNAGKDYLSSLSKAFEEARPPINRAIKKSYGGVSDRIQRLIDQGKIKPPKV